MYAIYRNTQRTLDVTEHLVKNSKTNKKYFKKCMPAKPVNSKIIFISYLK